MAHVTDFNRLLSNLFISSLLYGGISVRFQGTLDLLAKVTARLATTNLCHVKDIIIVVIIEEPKHLIRYCKFFFVHHGTLLGITLRWGVEEALVEGVGKLFKASGLFVL